jgi:hypothetical protein
MMVPNEFEDAVPLQAGGTTNAESHSANPLD